MRHLNRLAKTAVAPLLIAFIICVQVPAQIYWQNSDEFSLSLRALTPTLAVGFAILCALLLLPTILPSKAWRLRYRCFVQALALLTWFTASFRFGDYGVFDGGDMAFEPLSTSALLELGVWFGVLLLAVAFSRRLAPSLWQAVAGILLLSVGTLTWETWQVSQQATAAEIRPKADSAAIFQPSLFIFSKRKNVIHIVLDELQSTVMQDVIKHDTDLNEVLDGFVYYPDTAANYASTYMAVSAMLTGKIYRNAGDKEKFMDAATQGDSLPNVLQHAGFRVDHHTIPTQCEGKRLPHCSPIPTGLPVTTALSLIDFGFLRAVPEFFKAGIHNQNAWFVTNLFYGGSYHATTSGMAHVLFGQFNRKLRVDDDAPPTYKFFHSMLTHQPLTLTASCGARAEPVAQTLPNRRAQARCAFKHVKRFLEKLKALGIYDQTMVVISSDHGSNIQSQAEIDQLIEAGIPPVHYSRALATLLVKPFAERGRLGMSSAPAQLSDIPNTVLADLNLDLLDHGKDLAALTENAQRQREYMYFRWDFNIRTLPQLQEKLSYWIRGDVRAVQSWQPAKFADYHALRPSQALRCGDVVNFSDKRLPEKIATAGLGKAESWGRWTTGGKAIMYFRYVAEDCRPRQLEIQARAFVNEKNPQVAATLHLNGKPLGQLVFSEQQGAVAQRKQLSLPRHLLKEDEPNMLEFDIRGAISPRYLGMDSNDERLLGLALISLTLDGAAADELTQQ